LKPRREKGGHCRNRTRKCGRLAAAETGDQGNDAGCWNHTIPQRKTRLQATKIFNAQDERQFKSAFFYPTHVSHAKADKSSTKRSLDRVARNPKQKRIARTRNGSPQRYAKRGSEERRRHLISFPRARALATERRTGTVASY